MSDIENGVMLSLSTVEAMKRLAQGKATSEQGAPWRAIEELRARVEALEAAQQSEEADIVDYYAALGAQHQGRAVFHDNSKPTPNPSQIRSSLVERVSRSICYAQQRNETGSRAAIREVAAWLREQHDGDLVAATVLEREAEQ